MIPQPIRPLNPRIRTRCKRNLRRYAEEFFSLNILRVQVMIGNIHRNILRKERSTDLFDHTNDLQNQITRCLKLLYLVLVRLDAQRFKIFEISIFK